MAQVFGTHKIECSADGHCVRDTGQCSQLRGAWMFVTAVGDAVADCAHHCPHVLCLVHQAAEALGDGIGTGSNALAQTLAQLLIDDHGQPIGELAATIYPEPVREEFNVVLINAAATCSLTTSARSWPA